ncbi:MAG: hypothetical protein HQL75_00440 [Magnetococcales bacterium]|nr:hypothetical protein [Magnetococcales bacterium]
MWKRFWSLRLSSEVYIEKEKQEQAEEQAEEQTEEQAGEIQAKRIHAKRIKKL